MQGGCPSDAALASMLVMPGLGPGIHDLNTTEEKEVVDGRAKPGHDA
jgi:hypothetical protein